MQNIEKKKQELIEALHSFVEELKEENNPVKTGEQESTKILSKLVNVLKEYSYITTNIKPIRNLVREAEKVLNNKTK